MTFTNFHSHSEYCDGREKIENHIIAAINSGIQCFGITSHAPVPFASEWSMPLHRLPAYLNEIDNHKINYDGQIEIYKGLEVDFIPGVIQTDTSYIKSSSLDFTIGSLHFVGRFSDGTHCGIDGPSSLFEEGLKIIYHNNIRKIVKEYFKLTRQMLEESCPDILGHMDKIKMHNEGNRFFSEEEKWYRDEVIETLQVARKKSVIIEVNTRGIYKKKASEPYPSYWVLKEIRKLGIPIMLNSDSHTPNELLKSFDVVIPKLISLGFLSMRVLHKKIWQDIEFDESGLKL